MQQDEAILYQVSYQTQEVLNYKEAFSTLHTTSKICTLNQNVAVCLLLYIKRASVKKKKKAKQQESKTTLQLVKLNLFIYEWLLLNIFILIQFRY